MAVPGSPPAPDDELWERLRWAQAALAERWLGHPAVSMIDIGEDPEAGSAGGEPVLRVYVEDAAAAQSLDLPQEMNGIPVRVVIRRFRLE